MTSEKDEGSSFEAALERTGNGLYNILLVATCGLILLGIGVDLFGFSLVVVAACDLDINTTQKGILTSLPFIGILIVSYPWGYISDTKGRRFSLIISVQVAFVLSCLASLAPNWICLGVIKFLSVCFSCAANSATYTLVGESCMQRVRGKYVLIITCLLILSPGFAAVLAYPTLKLTFNVDIPLLGITFTPWRFLNIVLALPAGLGGVAICFFHESPKFLASCGRKKEAVHVLKSIYSINNGRNKHDEQLATMMLEAPVIKKHKSLFHAMHEQSAPLFRLPLLWRTLQLFFIVFVVYITNNSFLVWLPFILNVVRASLDSATEFTDLCQLISTKSSVPVNSTGFDNATSSEPICLGYVENNTIITLAMSQCTFAFLNFIISYLMPWRKVVLLTILFLSALSGLLINIMPEPVSAVIFVMAFTGTNLGMGILASYFVDLYPTSCRGMATCLSIMVGRTSAFIGINLIGNVIFTHCHFTFYFCSVLVFSSVVVAWFLPSDKAAIHAPRAEPQAVPILGKIRHDPHTTRAPSCSPDDCELCEQTTQLRNAKAND
ncbi:synaptic vesicle glycoprotein 2B-like [Colias croceus]|uniref:synaptic vesicle glycoprotein 2B-like n=1 Tax=Colias crocea TaxID=72248 RepID=UPI001E27CC7C|nr:synaptic vesicle glycoprotein 2B-like [Colias croceus]